jgi:hypothetical protein
MCNPGLLGNILDGDGHVGFSPLCTRVHVEFTCMDDKCQYETVKGFGNKPDNVETGHSPRRRSARIGLNEFQEYSSRPKVGREDSFPADFRATNLNKAVFWPKVGQFYTLTCCAIPREIGDWLLPLRALVASHIGRVLDDYACAV